MTSRSLPALASTVVLGVCLFAAPSAQAINVDSAFGTGGTLFTPASETLADRYQAATNGPGGVTYQAGYVNVGSTDRAFFVTKLKADGTLDTTFGTNGYAIKNVVSSFTAPAVGATPSGSAESAKGIAVQSDGKIVVVGVAETDQNGAATDTRDQDLYVIRLNTDGSLDTTFGDAGVRRFPGSNGLPAPAVGPTPTPAATPTAPAIVADQAWGISIRPTTDEIVLTISKGTDSGDTDGRTDRDLGAVQLTAGGDIDTSFGTNNSGAVYARTPSISEAARGNVLDTDGKVVVAGYGALGGTGGSNRPSLPRFTANGVLDTTFGGDSAGTTSATQNPPSTVIAGVPGVATSAFGGAVAEAYAIAKSGTGYAVGAYGRNTGTQNRGMMYKFDSDGHWDTTWGEPGGLTFFPGTVADAIRDFTAVSGGFVGAGSRGTDAALFVAKADGTRDLTSSTDGVLTVDLGGTSDSFYGVRETTSRKVIAAGYRTGGAGVQEDSSITKIDLDAAAPTPSPTPVATPTPTPVATPTPTPTPVATPTPTATPTPVATPTPTPVATPTPAPTATPAPTPTPVVTPTPAPTAVPTPTLAPSIIGPVPSPVPTATPTPAPVEVKGTVTAPKTAKAGGSVDYKVKLTGVTGEVVFTITVPGKKKATKVTVEIKGGTAKTKIKGLKAGTYKVSWTFAGNAKAKAAKGSSTIKVTKKP